MIPLRVSATEIDAYRRYRNPPDGVEIELDDLLRQLRKQEPPSESMLAGSALHKILENASDGEMKGGEADGFCFSFDFDAEMDLPSIRELKGTRDYPIGDFVITLVGKVDAVHGRRIDDHKFTSRYDAERFLSSYQWRIYLDVFDATEFRWNIFEGRESAPKHYIITNFHQLKAYSYPNMHDDIERELTEFLGFARCFLPERFADAA